MPFCHLRLSAPLPLPQSYPRELKTLGDYLRKARLDRGLRQEDAARELDVTPSTVTRWEGNLTRVAIRFLPKVVAFLGYDPREEGGELGERVRMLRERQGLSQVGLAAKLGVDTSTVARLESGRVRKLFPKVRRRFEEFLAEG